MKFFRWFSRAEVAEAKARIDANPMLRLGRRVFCIFRILNTNRSTGYYYMYWILVRVLNMYESTGY